MITIRKIKIADLEDFYKLLSDPKVMEFLESAGLSDPHKAKADWVITGTPAQ